MVDAAVGNPVKHQAGFYFADAFDAGPPVVWIALRQVRQVLVDGVGVDIDERRACGSVSVDGRDSVPDVGRLV
ncbi:hypothetical protein [Mycobacterium barrassiae]|uniref:hypothetical protein n=1 Tax=Mycobacterium barrassiae TaxID=319709 RepID=UPI002265A292|nr:hypothetical protein [Mycobacterium barrassiae]